MLRDSEGEVKGFFSVAMGELGAFEAEVKAIRVALEFCREFGVRHVLIESGSALVVGWASIKVDESRTRKGGFEMCPT